MFNKKPRRNFRRRKGDSSDEEDEQKKSGDGEEKVEAPAVINKPSKVAHGRGISCSSKRETTPSKPDSSDGEEGIERTELAAESAERRRDKDQRSNAALSFTDDKEGKVVLMWEIKHGRIRF